MDKWDFGITYSDFAALLENITATRWAWRNPTVAESQPDAAGRVLLSVRDETRRVRCLGSDNNTKHRLFFSVWVDEARDMNGETWREIKRFPRVCQFRQDMKGRWGRIDLAITSSSNEWKYLAPASLRALLNEQIASPAEAAR